MLVIITSDPVELNLPINHFIISIDVLAGLERQSAANPGDPPLYLHTSGLCIVGDGARGEPVDEAKIPRYTDTTFTVNSVPADNCHVNCDSLIIEAGTRKENPVRTIIMYPAWVYGLGEGKLQVVRRLAFLSEYLHRLPQVIRRRAAFPGGQQDCRILWNMGTWCQFLCLRSHQGSLGWNDQNI